MNMRLKKTFSIRTLSALGMIALSLSMTGCMSVKFAANTTPAESYETETRTALLGYEQRAKRSDIETFRKSLKDSLVRFCPICNFEILSYRNETFVAAQPNSLMDANSLNSYLYHAKLTAPVPMGYHVQETGTAVANNFTSKDLAATESLDKGAQEELRTLLKNSSGKGFRSSKLAAYVFGGHAYIFVDKSHRSRTQYLRDYLSSTQWGNRTTILQS